MRARLAIAMSIVLVASALALAGEGSWTGYVTDSKCGAKAAHEGAEDCTVKCMKAGAKLVFVNDADKRVYAIADQDKVTAHAGHHVTVKGRVEELVDGLEPAARENVTSHRLLHGWGKGDDWGRQFAPCRVLRATPQHAGEQEACRAEQAQAHRQNA